MFLVLSRVRRFAFLAPLAFLALPGPVEAGWLGFRNDTSVPLVVREIGPGTRLGKPLKIFANETVRDTPPAGGQRTFTIADPARPDRPLYTGRFATPPANENVLYVIRSDGKGGLQIEVLTSPVGIGKYTPKR